MADLSDDDRAEPERLRQETPSTRGRGGRVARWIGACAVLLVAAIFGGVAVVAVYLRSEVLDTNAYVETGRATHAETGRALAGAYRPLRVVIVLAAIAGFIAADRPGIPAVLWATVAVVVPLIVLEILVRAGTRGGGEVPATG
jgi:hypothetical protein